MACSEALPICSLCRKNRAAVWGCRFCPTCYYPGLDEDYNRYLDLRAEGYSVYQSRVMSGLQDPEVLNGAL